MRQWPQASAPHFLGTQEGPWTSLQRYHGFKNKMERVSSDLRLDFPNRETLLIPPMPLSTTQHKSCWLCPIQLISTCGSWGLQRRGFLSPSPGTRMGFWTWSLGSVSGLLLRRAAPFVSCSAVAVQTFSILLTKSPTFAFCTEPHKWWIWSCMELVTGWGRTPQIPGPGPPPIYIKQSDLRSVR